MFDDGRRAKDFATGEHFDVFDFVCKACGCKTAEAIRFVEKRLGITRPERKPAATQTAGPKLPPLRAGTPDELRELADRRGFAIEALRLAESRGFLRFCTLWGNAAWCLKDARGQLHEFRRVDGRKWPAYGRLPERKAHCTGTGKAWPLGVLESEPFPKIAMVEGAPDCLAAIHFILLEKKLETVAPVAILGASNHRLAPEALAHFKGKLVCLYPHADEAGRKAAREWARQLKEAEAARVTAFDFSGLVLVDGSEGKDFADVCRMNADCFERERKFWEVMP
ncbi:MAG: toprim domain-containing protein [Verrucomicrobia bacterium]|nr:toprim domain-containing protein [Verrucomicrobiota bacterium]